MDLAEFLLARIAEDEEAARAAGERFGGGPWEFDGDQYVTGRHPFAGAVRGTAQDPRIGSHIARWDPARVLAECDAKRRIVEMHSPIPGLDPPAFICETCGSGENYEYPTEWPCDTLKLLALPYADHPDYRSEWAP